MGLFNNKQPAKARASDDDAAEVVEEIFDQEYRDDLRQVGRDHFKKLLNASAIDLKDDIDATMKQVARDLKDHMMRQMDVTIAGINTEITNQLNERISEFSRVTDEAQELATQSLNRNAQAVYDKYQQLSATLQRTIASQEVMMITVFEENKNKATAIHAEQDRLLESLADDAEEARHKSEELNQKLQQSITDQSDKLSEVYQQNQAQIESAREAQNQALATLNDSVDALKKQHQELSELLDKSVADQKAMLVDTINDHMARIIEHYLVGALGEQSDIKAQLPSILEQMEHHKQAMVDDMKL